MDRRIRVARCIVDCELDSCGRDRDVGKYVNCESVMKWQILQRVCYQGLGEKCKLKGLNCVNDIEM